MAAFRRALYLDPAFVMAHYALAHSARARGKGREASRHLIEAAALLRGLGPEQTVPESDGLTASRLAAVVASMREAP